MQISPKIEWTVYYPPDSRLIGLLHCLGPIAYDGSHQNSNRPQFGGTFFNDCIVFHALEYSLGGVQIIIKMRVLSHYALILGTDELAKLGIVDTRGQCTRPCRDTYPVQIITAHRVDDLAPANKHIPRGYALTRTVSHTKIGETVAIALDLLREEDYGLGDLHEPIMREIVRHFAPLPFYCKKHESFWT